MKIGLVGEAPNDTQAIWNLLAKKYNSSEVEFCFLLNRIHGSQLDNQKTKRLLRLEYEDKRPNIVVFIRDLDSVLPNDDKLQERKEYFASSNSVVDKKGLYLLNIYEIEALILADNNTFNKIYGCTLPYFDDPMKVSEPKEELKKHTAKYNESDNPDIFKELNFDQACRCVYFKEFVKKLDKELNELKVKNRKS